MESLRRTSFVLELQAGFTLYCKWFRYGDSRRTIDPRTERNKVRPAQQGRMKTQPQAESEQLSLFYFAGGIGDLRVPPSRRRSKKPRFDLSIFSVIKQFAFELAGTIIVLVWLYREVMHEILRR